ncbi:MAG: S-methyl-5'-thioadenosine phosphorylase [Proteobacteria bacterium]|nr:S-methyl-5'-thioadenosine phosphorylase [Pseudomonadota bacterium]
MEKKAEIAIIGGSGLSEIEGMHVIEEVEMDTPFGRPSDRITIAEYSGRRVAFLPRHGHGHRIPPTHVPYAANIWALKKLGVFWVITFSAVGSLNIDIAPEHFCIPDQLIDRTRHRRDTFFDDIVVHVSFAHPFNEQLRQILLEACRAEGVKTHDGGTYVCMEGPAFSTKAESELYRSWHADLVGMTAIPEAKLAMEAEMAYASVCQATDYDCWLDQAVTVEEVLTHMKNNVANVHRVIQRVIPMIPLGTENSNPASSALACALTTNVACIQASHREKYELLLGKYVDFDGHWKH